MATGTKTCVQELSTAVKHGIDVVAIVRGVAW
jgi:hypothetical protein